MSIRLHLLEHSSHVERVEIVHDPTIPDHHFLQVELTVVGVKLELVLSR